jgi:hypothetical protein
VDNNSQDPTPSYCRFYTKESASHCGLRMIKLLLKSWVKAILPSIYQLGRYRVCESEVVA